MTSISYVASQLSAAGLEVKVADEFILAEDHDLGFEQSHDGIEGVFKWYESTLEEYEQAQLEKFQADLDEQETAANEPQEEPMNVVELFLSALGLSQSDPAPGLFTRPAPPIKEHASIAGQLKIAQAYNSPKEVAQALRINDQDRGGIPRPGGYEMSQNSVADTHAAVAVILTVGQCFKAPKGYKIKEVRPSGKVLFNSSILKGRKLNNALKGAKFSLVSL